MNENDFYFGAGGDVFGEGPEEGLGMESREERFLNFAAKVYKGANKISKRLAPTFQKVAETAGPMASMAVERVTPIVKTAVEKATPVVKSAAEKALPIVETAVEKATPVVLSATEKVMDRVAEYIRNKQDGTIQTEATEIDADEAAQRIMYELAKLDHLYADGIISEEEYEREKFKLFQ